MSDLGFLMVLFMGGGAVWGAWTFARADLSPKDQFETDAEYAARRNPSVGRRLIGAAVGAAVGVIVGVFAFGVLGGGRT